MAIPLRNQVYEIIKESESITDAELQKALSKAGIPVSEDRFNKILLDLEIMGLVKVSWLAKETRRIELITAQEEDVVEEQNREMMEKDYEASFPGAEE